MKAARPEREGTWRVEEYADDHSGYGGRGRWRVTRGEPGETLWFLTHEAALAVCGALNGLASGAVVSVSPGAPPAARPAPTDAMIQAAREAMASHPACAREGIVLLPEVVELGLRAALAARENTL